MGLLDEAAALKPTEIGGSGSHFTDADTITNPNGGRDYRIAGVDAGEVDKLYKDQNGEWQQKTGTAGGYESTQLTSDLANKQGFTNIKPLSNPDGSPQVGHFGRPIADLTNDAGQSFSQELLKAGAYDATRHTDAQSLAAIEIAKSRRDAAKANGTYVASEFDKAAALIDQAELGEGAKSKGFKETLLNEQERGLRIQAFMQQHDMTREEAIKEMDKYYVRDTQIDNFDRNVNNESNNPLSDSWELGWNGAREGAYGFLELLGESTGAESLEQIGTDGIARNQRKASEYAHILTDWKDVDGFSSGVSFLANNAAMSLPYMATTFAAGVAGAGLTAATGGGFAAAAAGTAFAVGAPASVYSGQVWNEMEGEKSATVALTAGLVQASLDRLGIGAIKGLIPGKATAEGVKAIMKSHGVTKQVAQTTLANSTKGELGGFLKDSAALATQQVASKKVGMDLLKRFTVGAGGEAVTEAGQEAIGYIAATQGSDKEFRWDELNERLIAAAIAGGSLGGAFSTPGGIKDALANYDADARTQEAVSENESDAAVWAAEEKAELGREVSIEEHLAVLQAEVATGHRGTSANERADAGQASYKALSGSEKVKSALLNPLAALQTSGSNVLNKDILSRSKNARVLSSLIGGQLQRVHSGSSFEAARHHQTSIYKNIIKPPAHLYAALSQGKRVTAAVKTNLNKNLYAQLNTAVNQDGNFDPALIPDSPTKQAVVSFGNELNMLSDKMLADQNLQGAGIKKLNNYLFKYKSVDKQAIHKNRAKFSSLLQSEYKYDSKTANDLVDRLADDPNATDLGEAYSVLSGDSTSSAHKERTLALSENPKFQEFMNQDPFANVDAATKAASRFVTNRKYLGKDNAIIGRLLDKMQQDGLAPAEVDKVAAGVRDIIDAESGNYKRPTSAVGKKLQKYQKSAMTLMTLSGLPLATLSSVVELALVNKSLAHDQVFGKEGSLRSIGTEGAATLAEAFQDVGSLVTRKETDPREATKGQAVMQDLGFKDWDVGAGAVAGVTEVNAYQQRLYQGFFKAIGLTQYTDMTRAIRASMGADYINSKVEILANQRNNGTTRTREVQEAEEALRNLGVSPDLFVEHRNSSLAKQDIDPAMEQRFQQQWREGTFSWVNDAIALPGAANRPLIYQDPRFALFTQFQGFISAFTANHIPKMWAEQVKRGTPAQKYSAFATMATMIMLGFLSQGMKDIIKYGPDDEDDETGHNPHLKTADYIRRGVFSSGLLGTAERAISFLDPVYDTKSDGAADWAFNTAVGESPALSYVQRVGGAGAALLEGDVGKFTKNAVKAAPGIGPWSWAADQAGAIGDNWNFNGE